MSQPKKIKDELVEYSLKAHSILNCNCISRVDYRYDEKNQKFICSRLTHSQA